MLVKKLKSGKLSVKMEYEVRDLLFGDLCNVLESESVNLLSNRLKTEADIARFIYYSTLNHLFCRSNWHLQTLEVKRIIITRAEAAALMYVFKSRDKIVTMLNIKSAIHQALL